MTPFPSVVETPPIFFPTAALPVFIALLAPAVWAVVSHAREAEQEPSPHPALLSLDLRGSGHGTCRWVIFLGLKRIETRILYDIT